MIYYKTDRSKILLTYTNYNFNSTGLFLTSGQNIATVNNRKKENEIKIRYNQDYN